MSSLDPLDQLAQAAAEQLSSPHVFRQPLGISLGIFILRLFAAAFILLGIYFGFWGVLGFWWEDNVSPVSVRLFGVAAIVIRAPLVPVIIGIVVICWGAAWIALAVAKRMRQSAIRRTLAASRTRSI